MIHSHFDRCFALRSCASLRESNFFVHWVSSQGTERMLRVPLAGRGLVLEASSADQRSAHQLPAEGEDKVNRQQPPFFLSMCKHTRQDGRGWCMYSVEHWQPAHENFYLAINKTNLNALMY